MKIALSHSVEDAATQRAVRQLEGELSRLQQRIPVTGSTSDPALKSLLAALERLGLISDETT